ncbi:hypothetical protein SDRG_00030 [Saprolegnia diclina VS20]|uniref:Uncharacterized protein n=1 Tax=Saprolegnia diclina (strain VS20) TaxID=1156394 RepID=T0R5S4_SAPDV|nr:hypothetical protein SDRG_00030 [Saprolegnia diclina VS20]EQC42291.1 hypothetical protein SDRG_00030 [Saprolegnia diclina VS20]|eukprot:XP_008603714.1 hypothetical protein SDRG_00030 [Saprolegnia diclina VS20]
MTTAYADAPELLDMELFHTWSTSFLDSAPALAPYYRVRGHDDAAVGLPDYQLTKIKADAAAEVPVGVKGRRLRDLIAAKSQQARRGFASMRLFTCLPKAVQRDLSRDGVDMDPFNLWQKLLGLVTKSPVELCTAFHALVASTATASVPAPDDFNSAVGAVLDGLLAYDAAAPWTPETYRAAIAAKLKTLLFAHPARMRSRQGVEDALNAWDFDQLVQLASAPQDEPPPDVVAPRPVARASDSGSSRMHVLFRKPAPPADPTEIPLLAQPSGLRPLGHRPMCGILDDDNDTSDSESPPPSPDGRAAALRRPPPLRAPVKSSLPAPARQPRLTTYGQQTLGDIARRAEQQNMSTKAAASTSSLKRPAKRRASSPSPTPAKRSAPRV